MLATFFHLLLCLGALIGLACGTIGFCIGRATAQRQPRYCAPAVFSNGPYAAEVWVPSHWQGNRYVLGYWQRR